MTRTARIHRAILFGINLHSDVCVLAKQGATFATLDAAEENAEVPIAQLKAEKEKRSIGEFRADAGRDDVVVARDVDQVVEVVVLREHKRLGIA